MIDTSALNSAWHPGLIMPGVAKCGTTTLYDILVTHDEICGGFEKEVRYLMDADEAQPRRTDIHKDGPQGWRDQYPKLSGAQPRYWIDATPQYQYQNIAKTIIGSLANKPLILFIVRKPSDRLYSMYQYAKYHQRTIDFIPDFLSFINAIKNEPLPELANQTMLSNAWKDSDFQQLYSEWLGLVGKDNIALVTLEGLINDPAYTMKQIAGFLDIDAALFQLEQGQQANPTVITKSRAVRKVGSKIARILPENQITRTLKEYVKSLNSGSVSKDEKTENAELLKEIDNSFAKSWAWTQSISING